MQTVYSPDHRLRDSKSELHGGLLVPPFEKPERAELVRAAVEAAGQGAVVPPRPFGLEPVLRVHDRGYVEFLRTVWAEWQAAGFEGEVMAEVLPVRRTQARPGRHLLSRVGYYCMAVETAISAGTWEAAVAAKDVALSAAELVRDGAPAAFALCRPPGHHAAFDMFGGYCFLNNAAIAAQSFRDAGAGRVAVLDVDFHHGNGTQDVFYRRGDVLVASLHCDPLDAFPHFSGFADETGEGAGEGANLNLPLPPGTPWAVWAEALETALARIDAFGPDVLVVSLGVDTFEADPISFFKLKTDDFRRLGARIAKAARPTLYVMEGGYAVDAIGHNVVAVLTGHDGG